MSKERGLLVVIAAASGTGKSTVCQALLQKHPHAALSVSYTTRAPRPGERDGEHYHFVSEETFQEMISGDQLLEWAEVHGHFYGTGRTVTTALCDAGRDVLLDIDVQGARNIRKSYGEQAILIFLLPPSWDAMVARLRGRGTEDEATIARRLQTARDELPAAAEFDYLIVNDQLEDTVNAILQTLAVERRRAHRMQATLKQIIHDMNADLGEPSA